MCGYNFFSAQDKMTRAIRAAQLCRRADRWPAALAAAAHGAVRWILAKSAGRSRGRMMLIRGV